MIPVLFHLGPIAVYSYGLMMALGFISGELVMAAECRRRGITTDLASACVVWGAICGLAGARLLDVINNWPQYAAHPATIIFSGAGFVFYGGLIGGIAATWVVARLYGIPFLTVADMAAPALVLGQAFGRMGCQVSGDGDWGLPSTLPWAMSYPRAIVGWGPDTVLKLDAHGQLVSGYFPGVRVHPTPIYEVILYVAIFFVLLAMRKKVSSAGQILYSYLILAGLERFIVEFIRINPRIAFGLTEAQLISLVMIALGTAGWIWSTAHRTAPDTPEAVRA
jgi:phosphatidylglycerol:prolipoprotein diacylglycerol transferase